MCGGSAPNYSQWCHHLCHSPVTSGHSHDCWPPPTDLAFHGMRSTFETSRATIPASITAVHPYKSSSCFNCSDVTCQSLGACYGPCFRRPWSHNRGLTTDQGFSWVKHPLLNTLNGRAPTKVDFQDLESGSNNLIFPVETALGVSANESLSLYRSPLGEALHDGEIPPEFTFQSSRSGSGTEDLNGSFSLASYRSPDFCITPLHLPSTQGDNILATTFPDFTVHTREVEKGNLNVLNFGDPYSSPAQNDSPRAGEDTESVSPEEPVMLGTDITTEWLLSDNDTAPTGQSGLVSPISMSRPGNFVDYPNSARQGASRRSSSTDGKLPYPSGCTFPGCSSKVLFTRRCDLTKHYKQHLRQFFCRVEGCRMSEAAAKTTEDDKRPIGFSTKKDRLRHEQMHNPSIICEHCRKVFSREDNLRDHVHRLHSSALA